MRLTVLGRWSPYPPADGACPGYLVEARGTRVLVDCGTGVLANLQRFTSVFDLDALIVTHLHWDHVTDIFPLKQALRYGRHPHVPAPLRLYAPADALDVLAGHSEPHSRSGFRERFALHPVEDGLVDHVGPFHLRFVRTSHAIPCFAVRVQIDEDVLVYSADTGPSGVVERLARGADLLLCESTLRVRDESLADQIGHLSARMAGEMAARAGVRALMLTHFSTPYGDYAEEAQAEAAKEFARDVFIARELHSTEV